LTSNSCVLSLKGDPSEKKERKKLYQNVFKIYLFHTKYTTKHVA